MWSVQAGVRVVSLFDSKVSKIVVLNTFVISVFYPKFIFRVV